MTEIREDDLSGPEIAALLQAHLLFTGDNSPEDSMHALDLAALRAPEITFWTAWDGAGLLGCGALKELSPTQGEIKSMHTTAAHRGKKIGARMLNHIMDVARQRNYQRISLETGSMEVFAVARALYSRHGFTLCGAFADYVEDRHSVFMQLELAA
jgi:putative acetyltransferase